MKKFISWEVCTIAFAVLFGSACVGLVSVVWGQQSEIATQKERVDGLKADIADMRASVEKKIDKLDMKMDAHLGAK
jgi:hypothetical protein